jgi:hypothetical protein
MRVKASATKVADGQTRSNARRFLGNGGRDARHWMKRLQQVGLRKARQEHRFQGRCHADRVAGRAVATLVGRALVILVVVMDGLVAHFMLVRGLRRSMVMTVVVVLKPCLELHWRRRAKDHSHSRVALEGYGKHHEPKQDCAQANHLNIQNLACKSAGGRIVNLPIGAKSRERCYDPVTLLFTELTKDIQYRRSAHGRKLKSVVVSSIPSRRKSEGGMRMNLNRGSARRQSGALTLPPLGS